MLWDRARKSLISPRFKYEMGEILGKTIHLLFKIFALLLLFLVGIGLFIMRYQKMPRLMDNELSISAKESSQEIIKNQFLILPNPKRLMDLPKILEALDLEIKMPLLNWILVSQKNHPIEETLPLASDKAIESRLILNSLLQQPSILDAQHDYVVEATLAPPPASASLGLPGSFARGADLSSLNLQRAWQKTEGSEDILVAVVDQFTVNGLFTFNERFPHCRHRIEFFSANLLRAFAASSELLPHGEIMALALGACNDQYLGSTGVDKKAKILAVDRPSRGHGETFFITLLASGINVCSQSVVACHQEHQITMPKKKPDVLLLPFGSNAPDLLQFTTDMLHAIRSQDIVVVTSAGNNHADAQNFFPGASPNTINVSAINGQGRLASFANFGTAVDILAPGEDIEFNYLNGPKNISGTSIAAAYVAGAASLIKSVNQNLSQKEIKYLITKAAKPVACDEYCLNDRDDQDIKCQDLCCKGPPQECGKLSLDVYESVMLASKSIEKSPLIEISNPYILFFPDDMETKNLDVKNIGDAKTTIRVKIFHDNVYVQPTELLLDEKGQPRSNQTLFFSLKEEPYKRQTYRVDIQAYNSDEVLDQETFYIEFIPKPGH